MGQAETFTLVHILSPVREDAKLRSREISRREHPVCIRRCEGVNKNKLTTENISVTMVRTFEFQKKRPLQPRSGKTF